jgi:hypothetical protein
MSFESDGGIIYWQGKTEELGEKPAPVPLCPPQIPYRLNRARTRASAVRRRRLTTWVMARPRAVASLRHYHSISLDTEKPQNLPHGSLSPCRHLTRYLRIRCRISNHSAAIFFFFPVPVCAITASGVPGGTLVSMNRFSTLCGWLVQRQGWRVKGWIWPSEQARSARANSWLDYQRPLEK